MKILKAAIAGAVLVWANAALAGSGFKAPVFRIAPDNGCAAADVIVTLAPDQSAISILRNKGHLLITPRDSKAKVRARCRFDLLVGQPPANRPMLQLDLRGAGHKFPASELEVKISVGQSHYRVGYPRGMVLDDSAIFLRFQVPAPVQGKVKVEIEATARSVDGKDAVQLSLDSFDACFTSADTVEDCVSPAPGSQ